MEEGFSKANSRNLPKIDLMMLGRFLASNKDILSVEFKNLKTSESSKTSYGDEAVCYVQLKRDGNLCTVKCKICPENKVDAKLYPVTVIVHEQDEAVVSVDCHDCVTSQGCKHAMAFLMWVHRRSEKPSCTPVEWYWPNLKQSRVGTTLKYMTTKELSNGTPSLPSNNVVFEKFMAEAKKRKLNCNLLKYQKDYVCDHIESLSMHRLVLKYEEKSCDTFLQKLILTDADVMKIEEETRDQHKSIVWHELRYGRVMASQALEFTQCQGKDEPLISLIMGGKFPGTQAMKHRKVLKDEVREIVSATLEKKIKKCGLLLSKNYPMLAGSPDGFCEDSIVEIKVPTGDKTFESYIENGKLTNQKKFYTQMQLHMYLAGLQHGYFCVADSNYSVNKNVEIFSVPFDENYVSEFLEVLASSWKDNVYPLLYRSTI